jgi:hypothetical protein
MSFMILTNSGIVLFFYTAIRCSLSFSSLVSRWAKEFDQWIGRASRLNASSSRRVERKVSSRFEPHLAV